jgi:hypothetical protein
MAEIFEPRGACPRKDTGTAIWWKQMDVTDGSRIACYELVKMRAILLATGLHPI